MSIEWLIRKIVTDLLQFPYTLTASLVNILTLNKISTPKKEIKKKKKIIIYLHVLHDNLNNPNYYYVY